MALIVAGVLPKAETGCWLWEDGLLVISGFGLVLLAGVPTSSSRFDLGAHGTAAGVFFLPLGVFFVSRAHVLFLIYYFLYGAFSSLVILLAIQKRPPMHLSITLAILSGLAAASCSEVASWHHDPSEVVCDGHAATKLDLAKLHSSMQTEEPQTEEPQTQGLQTETKPDAAALPDAATAATETKPDAATETKPDAGALPDAATETEPDAALAMLLKARVAPRLVSWRRWAF